MPPDAMVRPLMVTVPGEIPGAKTPPALTVTLWNVPVPLRNPPECTTASPAIDPLFISVPLFTVVTPVYVLAPANVREPVPTFVNRPPSPKPDAAVIGPEKTLLASLHPTIRCA